MDLEPKGGIRVDEMNVLNTLCSGHSCHQVLIQDLPCHVDHSPMLCNCSSQVDVSLALLTFLSASIVPSSIKKGIEVLVLENAKTIVFVLRSLTHRKKPL